MYSDQRTISPFCGYLEVYEHVPAVDYKPSFTVARTSDGASTQIQVQAVDAVGLALWDDDKGRTAD